MPTKEDRVIGPPGTGKTTFLTRVIGHNAQEYGADNVIAISHTRAAAAELAGRNTPIPRGNIGTMHSFAFHAIGTPPVAEDTDHIREFVDANPQWPFSAIADPEDVSFTAGGADGDKLMQEYQRRRNLEVPRQAWPMDVTEFATAWEDYKAQTATIDFTDMIEIAITDTDSPLQDPAVMIADECQDTSRLQWRLLTRWADRCEKFVTAGDPDQAIFRWAGADVAYFAENKPMRQKVLEQSYRVPRAVHAIATEWIEQATDREPVTYYPRDEDGAVLRTGATYRYPEPLLDIIEQAEAAGKTVMIQASCGYMLRPLIEVLKREGIPFANPWRVKQASGWNPLAPRGGASTVAAIRAFLKPHIGGALWTQPEADLWLSALKGVLAHGCKKRFSELPDNWTPEEVWDKIGEYLQDPDDLDRIIAPPPACLDWFEAHLLSSKQQPAAFPLHVARKRGGPCLQEEPRVYIGTCHSFKGAEADINVVFPDLSYQGYSEWQGHGRNDVVRLFYVAITRTRETLYIGNASSGMGVWS
jgi:DNA helicase II / ATP-dependent DNA helicase PcrA